MTTDTSEKGLESIIEAHLLNTGWVKRTSQEFDRDFCVDTPMLRQFLLATQPEKVESSHIFDTPAATRKFLERVKNQITSRGVVDVLRHGIDHQTTQFTLYYPTPLAQNAQAVAQYNANIFAVTRQLHFSNKTPKDSVDVMLAINGLPVITMELKNSLTNQTVEDAVDQYKTDRSPKELLFMPKRCAVHFAVDDAEVRMCTELSSENSWFLPFNKGCDDGAGNPVNPNGLKTSYLWEEILQKPRLSEILENYAQVIYEKKAGSTTPKDKMIWPRYHQLQAVSSLLADTQSSESGRRYLIQHSAGSGKSNSITWLAFQLVNLKEADGVTPRFESTIVVTDRINLDKQIRDNIRAFCNNKNIVTWAEDSEALVNALKGGKKIIVSTICKFPFILNTLGKELADKRFAVIIDEAHSSQSGNMSSSLNRILSGFGHKGLNVEDNEDGLNELMTHVIAGRVLAKNTNFYAFTATPKNKTLEMFGEPYTNASGEKSFRPFHVYSMRQAIEEGFIMDVLEHYTTYDSFYKILKATESNPEFDKKQANKKLRAWVESRPETVDKKARIMVEHFHECVAYKMGGEARAMIICNGIERAIDYFFAVKNLLKQRNSPYQAIVAFSGSKLYNGKEVDERILNQFPSSNIEKTFRSGNYRFLIVADKFQTGYDEPLLHTMYVDKSLSSIKTVQTLSRLNRCHPLKQETYVLDFVNKAEDIQNDFQTFFKTTILSHETDINKLSDKISLCDHSMVYTDEDIDEFNTLYWSGKEREMLDPILDRCCERFKELPTGVEEEDVTVAEYTQINIKSAMKNFVRLYEFLSAIRPISRPDWEKRVTFIHMLIKKLPVLKGEDLTNGLLKMVDFDRYRVVKGVEQKLSLESKDTTIDPIPVSDAAVGIADPEMQFLNQIVDDFNRIFGDLDWGDKDIVDKQVSEVVRRLSKKNEVRDSLLNNDEDTQLQVVHEWLSNELGIISANSTEMHRRYVTQPDIQEKLDLLVHMRLIEKYSPPFNQQLVAEKLLDHFSDDFKELCGVNYRHLEEVIEWFFRVLDTDINVQSLSAINKIKKNINLIYRTECREEDLEEGLRVLLSRFEAYLKKIYYIINNVELVGENGRYAQFLDAAKAAKINHLHFDVDDKLNNLKSFYEFVHQQRNVESHGAPEVRPEEIRPGIHMTMAMYLYATMINITDMESSSIFSPTYGEMDMNVPLAAENTEKKTLN
ncbi:MAG: type I restriction endonuclease [Bacteroidia bacterium]|nr:type I restriction endonuclease [Bacteroidia bacterium]